MTSYVESKISKLTEKENRMVVARCQGEGGGIGEMLVKGYKLSVISSGDHDCS